MNDTNARLWHPWLRINRVLRAMLHERDLRGRARPADRARLSAFGRGYLDLIRDPVPFDTVRSVGVSTVEPVVGSDAPRFRLVVLRPRHFHRRWVLLRGILLEYRLAAAGEDDLRLLGLPPQRGPEPWDTRR